MPKQNKQKSKKSKSGKSKRAPTVVKVMRGGGALSDPRVQAWDQLLRDPCSSNLTMPCYGGTDSGYLIRTTNTFSAVNVTGAGLVVGNVYPADVVFQVAPLNWGTGGQGILISAATSGAAPGAFAVLNPTDFIATSGVVKRFRPVAACLKWMPAGPYTSRRGIVGMSYSPAMMVTSGDAFGLTGDHVSLCQDISTNGSKAHEVRWLPSELDQVFATSSALSYTGGCGTMFMVLQGVDATANGAASALLNGNIEITIVWEWVPAKGNAITVSPKSPLPYTVQQVLSTITDMGSFLFHGTRSGGGSSFAQGAIRAGARGAYNLLTSGYSEDRRRGPAFPSPAPYRIEF